jgi:PhnB protein
MTEIANSDAALTPHLMCDGAADAIDFYKQAFGAEELMRLPGPDGRLMHGAVRINGATVMLTDENRQWGALGPKTLGGSPVTLNLTVPNVDASFERAVRAGATAVMPVADQFWGDRYGIVRDPFGHSWALLTPIRQMSEAELREAAASMMANCGPEAAATEEKATA